MTTVQQYCLRWNNHQPNFISVFSSLLLNETLVDVTLAAEGRQLQAHKVVLSACSSYFQSLFTTNPCKHPIVILKDVQYNDLKTMVDFMYYGEVNVSTEQLPQILKTAEMLKIKGLAEMPDAASVTKSDSKSSDHTDGNQSISGVESMWGSTESQQQAQQQQYHTIRRTPSPSNMSPATRRKRLRKTSTGSGSINISASIERIQDEHQQQMQHQQQQATMDGRMMQKYSQQQSVDVPLSTFSAVSQTGAIANVRGMKINSSPENQMQHQQDPHEHIDESQHITEMKTEDLSCVNQSMPLDISTGTSTTPVSCPPTQQHSGGQWAVIDTNYSRFALTTSAAALPTSTVQHSAAHHHHHHHHEGNIATAQSGAQSIGHGNDNMSLGSNHSSSHGSNNSNSNNNATIQSQNSTPVQLQYQTTYSPQIIAVNPNNIVNNYPPSISTPNSPLVQSVYSQQSTPIQSPVNIQNSTNDASTSASNNNSVNANSSSGSINAAAPPKRKRSVNPQGEENFLRALDAVRFGGIGFCKAARLYGVNNRTLWLEFKKRGYPISRPSIKSRIKTEPNMSPPPSASTPSAEENTMENYESNIQQPMAGPSSSEASSTPIMCPPHHPAMGVMGFLDTRHVDFSAAGLHQMSRQRYADGTTAVNINPSSVNMQSINFNSI